MNAVRCCRDLGLVLILASCAIQPAAPVPDRNIEAAWVVLGEDGAAIARVITTAADCPDLLQDGVPRRDSHRCGKPIRDWKLTAATRPCRRSCGISMASASFLPMCR
jgi:hypothetical protein